MGEYSYNMAILQRAHSTPSRFQDFEFDLPAHSTSYQDEAYIEVRLLGVELANQVLHYSRICLGVAGSVSYFLVPNLDSIINASILSTPLRGEHFWLAPLTSGHGSP